MKFRSTLFIFLLLAPIYLFSIPNFKQKIINHYTRKISNLRKQDEYQKALSINNKLIMISPDNTDLFYWRALTYQDLEKYDLAVKDFTRTIELNEISGLYTHREEGVMYRNRGECRLAQEKYDLALADAETSIKRNPYHAINYDFLRQVYVKLKDYDKALEIAEYICQKFPKERFEFYHRAKCNYLLGNYVISIKDCDLILDKYKDKRLLSWTYYLKATAHYQLEQFQESLSSYQTISKDFPEISWHYGSLALLYYKMGNFKEANNCITKVYIDEPEYRDDIDSIEGFLDGKDESKLIFNELLKLYETDNNI